MKFKDLKVGQKFRLPHWHLGAINEKIEPTKHERNGISFIATSKALDHDLKMTWYDGNVKDDDEVILVK